MLPLSQMTIPQRVDFLSTSSRSLPYSSVQSAQASTLYKCFRIFVVAFVNRKAVKSKLKYPNAQWF